MKHFIVEINYKIPAEQMADIVAEHRQFLQTGYDQGLLLCSGPRVPRTGGMVVARAASLQEIQQFFEGDPYHQHDVAEHHFVEFEPVKRQEFLEAWVAGKPV